MYTFNRNPRRALIFKNTVLILLVGLIASAGILGATEPVALDFSKPIQVDVWLGPPQKDAVEKAGLDQKTMNEIIKSEPSNAYGYPMLIGCVMVGREIHRPFALPYEQCESTGTTLIVLGGNCAYRNFSFRQVKEDLQEFTCTLDSGLISGRAKCDYGGKNPVEVVWDGKIVGDRIEGTSAMILPGGKRLERPMLGLLRVTPNAGLDPQNAIYQLERDIGIGQQRSNYLIVVEFANGKPVAALARRAEGGTAMVEVDANQMSVTPKPATLSGRSAVIGGSLVVDGKPLTLEPFEVSPNGWVAKETERRDTWPGLGGIRTRVYPTTDPVAKRWKEWMTATYTGPQTLTTEMSQQVVRETAEFEDLPFPGPATAFTHQHIGNGQGKNTFIYAPWLNFRPVKDAKTYHFECKGEGGRGKQSYAFDAISPTASLRPIWKDLPVSDYLATCSALDAAGKSLGEPQKWIFEKRGAFFDSKSLGKSIPDPIATQLALRFPRTLAHHHYAQWSLFDLVFGAGMSPKICSNLSYIMRDPVRCLVRWSELPAERTSLQRGQNAYWTAIAQETENPLGMSIGYYSMYFCTVQDWGREVMDDFEATGKMDRLKRLQRSLTLLGRIQQPSGSWTLGSGGFQARSMNSPVWAGGFTMWRTAWLDHNSAAYSLGYGRYRHLTGDDSFWDCEIKANHWLAGNALRTGYWENQIQQGDPGCNRPTTTLFAQDYLLYLLEHAPAEIANLALAEDLARFLEDQFVMWSNYRYPVPAILGKGSPAPDNGHLRMAIIWLHLYRQSGKPVYLAKAEAFFTAYMQTRDPVEGLGSIRFNRYQTEEDDPWYALRYLELRQQILAEKPAETSLADATLVVNLNGAADGRERIILHLDCQGGKVARAIATVPTWQPVDIPFTQPGRLHHHEQTQFFHPVDAGKLTVGINGVQGEITVLLTPPTAGAVAVPTTFVLDVKPDARALSGTWTLGQSTGRVAGEIRKAAISQAKRLHLEISKAVTGGEAWQNWALARFELTDGKVSASNLGNNNSGWRAVVDSSTLALSRDTVTATMRVTVAWRGFMDDSASQAAKDAEWKNGNLDWLAHWTIGRPRGSPGSRVSIGGRTPGDTFKDDVYEPGFRPLPWPEHTRIAGEMVGHRDGLMTIPNPWPEGTSVADMERQGGQLEYSTSFRPVAAGTYEYRFEVKRTGDVLAGTVTVKGPDGKESVCQCFGSLE